MLCSFKYKTHGKIQQSNNIIISKVNLLKDDTHRFQLLLGEEVAELRAERHDEDDEERERERERRGLDDPQGSQAAELYQREQVHLHRLHLQVDDTTHVMVEKQR
jgi:hypothetical protein